MHKSLWRLGLRSRPRWKSRAQNAPPNALADIPTFCAPPLFNTLRRPCIEMIECNFSKFPCRFTLFNFILLIWIFDIRLPLRTDPHFAWPLRTPLRIGATKRMEPNASNLLRDQEIKLVNCVTNGHDYFETFTRDLDSDRIVSLNIL